METPLHRPTKPLGSNLNSFSSKEKRFHGMKEAGGKPCSLKLHSKNEVLDYPLPHFKK
jgi:hypothetical protein